MSSNPLVFNAFKQPINIKKSSEEATAATADIQKEANSADDRPPKPRPPETFLAEQQTEPEVGLEAIQPLAKPSELNEDRINDIFKTFDVDGSGDLDTFELFHAVGELMGKAPSTAQVET